MAMGLLYFCKMLSCKQEVHGLLGKIIYFMWLSVHSPHYIVSHIFNLLINVGIYLDRVFLNFICDVIVLLPSMKTNYSKIVSYVLLHFRALFPFLRTLGDLKSFLLKSATVSVLRLTVA